MIIFYTVRMSGKDADVSYNAAWLGCWAYAEIGLVLIVTCTLSLPKFVEAKGKMIRTMFSNIKRPIMSFTSLETFLRSTSNDSSACDTLKRNTDVRYQTLSEFNTAPKVSDHSLEVHPSRDEDYSRISVDQTHQI